MRFLVHGPRQLTIQVDKNYSLNTILAAVALDRAEEFPKPYFGPLDMTNRNGNATQYRAANMDVTGLSANDDRPATSEPEDARTVEAIRKSLRTIEANHPASLSDGGRKYYAALARWYQAALLRPENNNDWDYLRSLSTCYYHLQMFAQWEEQQKALGFIPARRIEKNLRWDGRDDTSPNEDHDLVLAYRLDHTSSSSSWSTRGQH
jgi:hypothetical protein